MLAIILAFPALIVLFVFTAFICDELIADWHQMRRDERRRGTIFAACGGVVSILLAVSLCL